MRYFKKILYFIFFLSVVALACGVLLGLLWVYGFLFNRFGEIMVVAASLGTFIWMANRVENSRFFQKLKDWFSQ